MAADGSTGSGEIRFSGIGGKFADLGHFLMFERRWKTRVFEIKNFIFRAQKNLPLQSKKNLQNRAGFLRGFFVFLQVNLRQKSGGFSGENFKVFAI